MGRFGCRLLTRRLTGPRNTFYGSEKSEVLKRVGLGPGYDGDDGRLNPAKPLSESSMGRFGCRLLTRRLTGPRNTFYGSEKSE